MTPRPLDDLGGPLRVRLRHRINAALTLDVDFAVGDEAAILFGRSGAGKSTLLRLIAGLDAADLGSVDLGGRRLFDASGSARVPLRARRVGFLFQGDSLFPHLDVWGNVAFGLVDRPRRDRDARVDEVAAICQVGHLLGRPVETLSGGERQRVGLARAIAPGPRLLLCDEPFSALDADARHHLIRRLGQIRRAEGVPMLYVTHLEDEAVALGDRMLRLDGGKVVADGRPIDVLSTIRGDEPRPWPTLVNLFSATRIADDGRLRLEGGPELACPPGGPGGAKVGSKVTVRVGADEIILAREVPGPCSARNVIEGRIAEVVEHGDEAEVFVETGRVAWVVSVLASAVAEMGLAAGQPTWLIIKARSCRVFPDQ